MKLEWEYMLAMALVSLLSFLGWQKGLVSDIHTLYALGGVIITLMVIIAFRIEFSRMNVGNFALQNAILMICIGFPALIRPTQRLLGAPHPYAVFVGTASEEIFRIAAFIMVVSAFRMPNFAIFTSGIVFAAMHLYWYPTEWLSAIIVGVLFSIFLAYYGSPTSCMFSHFIYDMYAFGYISALVYLIILFINLILGIALTNKKVEI